MKLPFLPAFLTPSAQLGKWTLVLITFAGYCLAFSLVYPSKGAVMGSLSVIPVIIVNWFFGMRAGVFAAALIVPLTALLAYSTGDPLWSAGLLRGGPGFVVVLLVGVVVGRLHDVSAQVAKELAQRKQAEAELTKLYNASSFLFKADSLLNLGHQIVQAVIQEFSHVDCGLLVVDKKHNRLLRLARAGAYEVQSSTTLYLDGPGLVAHALRQKEVIYAADVSTNPYYVANEPRTRSELVVPLKSVNGVIGVFDLQSDKVDAFTQRDQRILTAFAERAAAAIEVMLLYDEINQHVGELEWRVVKRTAEFEHAKKQFEIIVNTSSDAIIVIDAKGIIQHTNPALSALFDYSMSEVLGQRVTLLTDPLQEEMMRGILRNMLQTLQPRRLELTLRRKDGSTFTADVALSPTHVPDAEQPSLICSVRDMSERKRFEQTLQESETRYREFFEGVDDTILVHDIDGNIVDVNEAACRRLEYSRDELLKMKTADIDAPHYAEGFKDRLAQQFSEGKLSDINGVHMARDGRLIFVDLNTKVIVHHGQPAVLAVARDITQRKQMEQELRLALRREQELNELKSRFVSMVSHEFRTSLTTIQSSAETLKFYSQKMSDEQKTARLDKIVGQVQHLVQLLNDILNFSRADKVGMGFTPSPFNLELLVREIAEEAQLADPQGHSIKISTSNMRPEHSGDEKLLRHIITNLITNAVKYSPQGSTIELDLDCDEHNNVTIRVQDHGIGIPEADQKHLFEIFHRAKNVGAIQGTGLGLAIVKQATEAHGGTINVDSIVNVGTTFTVIIPMFQIEATVS